MLTATQLNEYAQLSQAAYIHFVTSDFAYLGAVSEDTYVRMKTPPNSASAFCETEAKDLTARYEILHQYADNPDSNGFSATLFRDKHSGKLVLGFRGTEFNKSNKRGQHQLTF